MTDITDLNEHRETKDATKRIGKQLDEVSNMLDGAMGSMNNQAFVKFVMHAEKNLPAHSVFKESWFNSVISSMLMNYVQNIPVEEVKTHLALLVDFLYESYVAQNGPPVYPPVFCESCAEHAKHAPEPTT